jgi:hypothetical protein
VPAFVSVDLSDDFCAFSCFLRAIIWGWSESDAVLFSVQNVIYLQSVECNNQLFSQGLPWPMHGADNRQLNLVLRRRSAGRISAETGWFCERKHCLAGWMNSKMSGEPAGWSEKFRPANKSIDPCVTNFLKKSR